VAGTISVSGAVGTQMLDRGGVFAKLLYAGVTETLQITFPRLNCAFSRQGPVGRVTGMIFASVNAAHLL